MTNIQRITLSFAVALIFAAAFSILPLPITNGSPYPSALQQPPPKLVGKQITTTGKISSVQTDAFVLDVTKPKKDSLVFFTDKNTAVEGDLKVGAAADVVYQKDDQGNLIAIKVHIN